MTARKNLEWSDGAAGPVLGLTPIADPREATWRDFAVCVQTDPEAFFPEKGGSVNLAKKICGGCFVREQCLEYALEHDERFGVWGGLSEHARRRLKRERGAA